MTEEGGKEKAIRSSAVIGAASIINILIGLIKIKVIAVFLGPSGVGLVGLLQNLISTVAVLTGLGINNVGTRQIAEAVGNKSQSDLAVARGALRWSAIALGAVGFFSFIFLAYFVFSKNGESKNTFGENILLAVAVSLTTAAGAQNALLTGMRQINGIAKISIYAALISTALSILAVWRMHDSSIPLVILLTPLSSFLVGFFFTKKISNIPASFYKNEAIKKQLKIMVKLGSLFMLGGLMSTVAQLAVRTLINESQGIHALGEFQAAWQISMLYLGFVLTAMGTDYYPRLTESIKDKAISIKKVNEQTEVSILLSAPVLFIVLGTSPWLVKLLYTENFRNAGHLLTWQILGDALKIISWPLGFVLLARGDGKRFLMAEGLGFGSFVFFTWLFLPRFGLIASGIGFIFLYAVYLPTVYYFAYKSIGFYWSNRNLLHILILCVLCMLLKAIAALNAVAGLLVAIFLSFSAIAYAVVRLTQLQPQTGMVGKMISKFK